MLWLGILGVSASKTYKHNTIKQTSAMTMIVTTKTNCPKFMVVDTPT